MTTEKATFCMGCFWGPDEFFSKLEGVISTRVGYAGGTKDKPGYYSLGDHTETIEMIFYPERITYKELLAHFWEQHDAAETHKTQYKSMILVHSNIQEEQAKESKMEWEQKTGKKATTEIKIATIFYPAEDYHQKYLQKRKGAVC
jgi:methionine-S-sulfoxide reductase